MAAAGGHWAKGKFYGKKEWAQRKKKKQAELAKRKKKAKEGKKKKAAKKAAPKKKKVAAKKTSAKKTSAKKSTAKKTSAKKSGKPDMSRSSQDFAAAFKGSPGANKNFVKIADVQAAMMKQGYTREQIVTTIQNGRRAGILTADSSDGNHVTLTKAQRDAGIREAGSNLVYISYRGRPPV